MRGAQRTALAGVLAALEDGLVASGAVQRTKRAAEGSSSLPPAKKARMFDLDSFDVDSDLSGSDGDWSDDDSLDELAAAVAGTASGESDHDTVEKSLAAKVHTDHNSVGTSTRNTAHRDGIDALVSGAVVEAQEPAAERLPLKEPVQLVGQEDDVAAQLDLDQFASAAELEQLGLNRLKQELQQRGLKCGGTVADRAARLFVLKSTPLEQMGAKHFAKAAKK